MTASYLTLDVTLSEDFTGIEQVILQLQPSWKWNDVSFKDFLGGITNKIRGYFHKDDSKVISSMYINHITVK